MFNEIVREKFSNILHFFLSTFKVLFASVGLSLVMFVILALIIHIQSGDWVLGQSFEEWWQTMHTSPIIDGKFSAIDGRTCWSCNIMAKTFDLMSIMGLKLYIYIADIAWTLIVMGFGVWILIYMYDNLIKEQSGDLRKMLREITTKIIVISIIGVGLFLTTDKEKNEAHLTTMVNNIVENTAVPVLKLGIGVSSEILNTKICDKFYYPNKTEVDGIITHGLKDDILCLMNSINMVYLSAMTAGSNMIEMATKGFLASPFDNAEMLPDIVAGMAINIIFFLMYLLIPFILIDIVFTLGILVCFLPLMIGGYAYKQTSSFSQMGIGSLWRMCFYVIIYSVFLGILYSSFIYIADMYYPAPLDNFTYLFPDFIYNDMVGSQTSQIIASEGFQNCYAQAGGNISKMQSCLLKIGIEFDMPKLDTTGGSFLPMFTFGLLSLMIMSNVKTYAGLISGYSFEVGKYAQNLLTSAFNTIKGGVSRAVSGFKMKKESNKLAEELKKYEKELKDKIT